MKVKRYLSRSQTVNACIIVIGTHILSLLSVVLILQFKGLSAGSSPKFSDIPDAYEMIAAMFFDSGGSIYTVLIGILAAGITLFSQTGARMSDNRKVADAQFKYFDLLSFAFNSIAAILGAMLVQATIFDLWGAGLASPVGTALVGCGVVWVVCSLLAPANFVARISQVEQLRLHRDRLRAYRLALVSVLSIRVERQCSLRGWGIPVTALSIAGATIWLSHWTGFRVDGGVLTLSPIWILVVLVSMTLSLAACFLVARMLAELKVSRLVNDSKSQIVNIGIFIFVCTILALCLMFISLSIIGSSPSVGAGGAVLVYLLLFGILPAISWFFLGIREVFIWKSTVKQISKSVELYEREVEMRNELLDDPVVEGEHSSRGYL